MLAELGVGDVMVGHVEGVSSKIEGGGLGGHVAKVELLGKRVETGYFGFKDERLHNSEIRVDGELNQATQARLNVDHALPKVQDKDVIRGWGRVQGL